MLLALTVLFTLIVSPVSAEITAEDIDRVIDKNKFRHPYLCFSEEEKPALRERIENDPLKNTENSFLQIQPIIRFFEY